MNILIVEDNKEVRDFFYEMVNSIGRHEISVLTNGRNALSVLADPDHGFDLVLLDIEMPRMSGSKVVDMIHDRVKVNFVIVTGTPYELPQLPEQIQVLRKPVEYGDLELVIANVEKRLAAEGDKQDPDLASSES